MIDASVLSLLVQSCAPSVAPQTMMALIVVESGGEPFRIGINSGPHMSRMPQSKAEAVSVAKRLIAQPNQNALLNEWRASRKPFDCSNVADVSGGGQLRQWVLLDSQSRDPYL